MNNDVPPETFGIVSETSFRRLRRIRSPRSQKVGQPETGSQLSIGIHYHSVLQRYVLIKSDDTDFAYAEWIDGLNWTLPIEIGTFGPVTPIPPP